MLHMTRKSGLKPILPYTHDCFEQFFESCLINLHYSGKCEIGYAGKKLKVEVCLQLGQCNESWRN